MKSGQTVRFYYSRGTISGPRLVEVHEVGDDYLLGRCRVADGIRRFSFGAITGGVRQVSVVADAGERVVLPREFLAVAEPDAVPGEAQAAVYRLLFPRVLDARFDADAGVLVVRDRYPIGVVVTLEGDAVRVGFVNARGEMIGVGGTFAGHALGDRKDFFIEDSPAVLADLLAKLPGHYTEAT